MLASGSLWAQTRPQYTQYIFNQLVINPAYAGSKGAVSLNAFHRSQWSGLEGGPQTQTFSVDGITKGDRLGLGIYASRDEIGAQNRKSIEANASVKIPVSATGILSFGIGAGASHYAVDGNKLQTGNDQNDPAVISAQKARTWSPDLRVGAFFHTERFYAGLSVTDLLGIDKDISFDPERAYFLTAGYLVDLGSSIKFKPSFMLKENFNGPTNIDANAFFLFKERIWLGGTYRTALNIFQGEAKEGDQIGAKDAVAVMAELFVTSRLRVGYAHDFTLTELSGFSTHEISVGYNFLKKEKTKMVTPRYF